MRALIQERGGGDCVFELNRQSSVGGGVMKILAYNVGAQIVWAVMSAIAAESVATYWNRGNNPFHGDRLIQAWLLGVFAILFLIPWLGSWLRYKGRTPLLFDAFIPGLISLLIFVWGRPNQVDEFVLVWPLSLISWLVLWFCSRKQKSAGPISMPVFFLTLAYLVILEVAIPVLVA